MSKAPSKWTPKAIATLARMLRAGATSAQIAKALGNGLTRNAILGKHHRMRKEGIELPTGSEGARKAVPEPKARPPARQHAVGYFGAGARPATEVLPRPLAVTPHDTIDPRTPGLLRMEDLKKHHCRWPLNSAAGGEYYFCGESVIAGKPYCQAHCDAAYNKPGARQHAKVR